MGTGDWEPRRKSVNTPNARATQPEEVQDGPLLTKEQKWIALNVIVFIFFALWVAVMSLG